MATEFLKVKNGLLHYKGKIVQKAYLGLEHNGLPIMYDAWEDGDFAETEYWRNRWDIRIVGNKIVVHTEGAGGFHKVFPLRDGTIGLYRGTDKRYAYFRSAEFQDFLNRFNLHKVVKEDSNQNFYGFDEKNVNIDESSKVFTDGYVDENCEILKQKEYGNSCFKTKSVYNVTDATWTILQQGYHRTLYTLVSSVFSLEKSLEEYSCKDYDGRANSAKPAAVWLDGLLKIMKTATKD